MNCKVCGKSGIKTIGAPVVEPGFENFIRHDYKVVRCRNCGFYFLDPEIDLSLYEWEKVLSSVDTINKYSKIMLGKKEIADRLDSLVTYTGVKDIDILITGCNTGLAVEEALSRGWKVTAVDEVDNRKNGARAEGVIFYEGEFEKLNFKGSKFDIIFSDLSLNRSANVPGFLTKIKSLLKIDGYSFIRVFNSNSLEARIEELQNKTSGKEKLSARIQPFTFPYSVSGFDKNNIKVALKRSSLKLIEMKLNNLNKSDSIVKRLAKLPLSITASFLNRSNYIEMIIKSL